MKGERYSVEELLANESLQRWVLGTASPDEEHYWDSYAQLNPENANAFEEACEVLHSLRLNPVETPSDDEIENEWEAVMRKVEEKGRVKQGPHFRLVSRFAMYRMAAAVALLVLAGAAFWGYSEGSFSSLFVHTYTTDYGERVSIQLADGSTVVLNAHSTLTSPRRFSDKSPFTVSLEGEAFFEVTSRPIEAAHHFNVRTPHGEVIVLGTAFNLNSRDNATRVTLVEGSLRIASTIEDGTSGQQTMLAPGQSARFGDRNPHIVIQEVNPLLHASWTTPQLWFHETPFQEIVSLLKHTYGYQVQVQDTSLHGVKISGTVENKQRVLLEGLSAIIDRSIIFEDGVVIIQ